MREERLNFSENDATNIRRIGEYYHIDGKLLSYHYKEHISGFRHWDQTHHAHDFVLFKQNLGLRLSMDETCLSQGELYTIMTNKAAKGTKSEAVLHYLNKLPRSKRLQVQEITIDHSSSMKLITKQALPNATIVTDRFHVQKLMNEALSDLRVDYRWAAIDQENARIALAQEVGRKFVSHTFDNGDTRRQLFARSRHIVMKHRSKWTANQRERVTTPRGRRHPFLYL